ncbi:MAG: hypothetical protein ACXVFF_12075 [Gaiellaceae bacterium]
MSHDERIGALVRSVAVPGQSNEPDIAVGSLDLHENGFVVRDQIRVEPCLRHEARVEPGQPG